MLTSRPRKVQQMLPLSILEETVPVKTLRTLSEERGLYEEYLSYPSCCE